MVRRRKGCRSWLGNTLGHAVQTRGRDTTHAARNKQAHVHAPRTPRPHAGPTPSAREQTRNRTACWLAVVVSTLEQPWVPTARTDLLSRIASCMCSFVILIPCVLPLCRLASGPPALCAPTGQPSIMMLAKHTEIIVAH